MDLSALASVDPPTLRAALPAWLAGRIDDPDPDHTERLRTVAEGWSDEVCRSMVQFLLELGGEHRVYRAHPACRQTSRVWCRSVLLEPRLEGGEHLAQAVSRGPTMLVGNHLSYLDANATDALLAWHGLEAIADDLVAVAGPKVYQDAFRRFAAGCINTLPVPQSTTLGHTAKLAPRELARRAKAGLDAARAELEQGRVVLIYPEGSRTRTGQLQPFLRGVHRWLSVVDDLQIVPAALVGTDAIMPLDDHDKAHPSPAWMRLGPALQVGRDGASREVLAKAHAALAALLPPALQPAPGTSATA